jgi:hypothetical protein
MYLYLHFVYLGGKISQKGSCSEDIQLRIGKAIGALQNLSDIWNSNQISTSSKMQLYNSLILPILMYGSETWTMKKEDENRLLVFEMTCLRKILGVTKLDKIRNTIIRTSLGLKLNVIERITIKRLRYFGHIQRMPQHRYPSIALNGYVAGKRPRGRPVKRWLDDIRSDCQKNNLYPIAVAGRKAKDRKDWKGMLQRMASLNQVGVDAKK